MIDSKSLTRDPAPSPQFPAFTTPTPIFTAVVFLFSTTRGIGQSRHQVGTANRGVSISQATRCRRPFPLGNQSTVTVRDRRRARVRTPSNRVAGIGSGRDVVRRCPGQRAVATAWPCRSPPSGSRCGGGGARSVALCRTTADRRNCRELELIAATRRVHHQIRFSVICR